MGYGTRIIFLSHILIHLIDLTIAQTSFFIGNACSTGAYYESNSTYRRNLDTVLSYISSNTNITYGFYNFTVGETRDTTVNAIALCRGDVELNRCRSCLNDATYQLRQVCHNNIGAIGWYEHCMVRYTNESIFHRVDPAPTYYVPNINNFQDMDQFNPLLGDLLDRLRSEAAGGGYSRKFATGDVVAPQSQNIYALVECTPDLSEYQCNECLQGVTRDIGDYYFGRSGAKLFAPSCAIRYELYNFYNNIQPHAPPPLRPPGNENNTSQIIISVVVPTISFVILVVGICIFIRKRKQWKQGVQVTPKKNFENAREISAMESLQYDFATINDATNHFSDTNKLGEGGFGAVYKGMLQNGREIAVKRLSRNSGQGELEFKNEVLLLARLQHRNLVRLLGFCLEGSERLLVYEFVPNASLEQFIFDPIKRATLEWDRRYKIIRGVARGILYLHEDSRLRIIHRDLKASNVLLDAKMNPKISDFGTARLFEQDETQGSTSRIAGTFGYMAPEYAMHGQFSAKSDVFSFGVLLLEIICGQNNHCFRNGENAEHLVSNAWKNWQEGTASNFIDPTLKVVSSSIRDIIKCIHIGLLCVQENVEDRPTMASVTLMFHNFSHSLPVPLEPTFFMRNNIGPKMPLLGEHNLTASESKQLKSTSSHCSVSISELYPR